MSHVMDDVIDQSPGKKKHDDVMDDVLDQRTGNKHTDVMDAVIDQRPGKSDVPFSFSAHRATNCIQGRSSVLSERTF